jgi:hypothetical protein
MYKNPGVNCKWHLSLSTSQSIFKQIVEFIHLQIFHKLKWKISSVESHDTSKA